MYNINDCSHANSPEFKLLGYLSSHKKYADNQDNEYNQ